MSRPKGGKKQYWSLHEIKKLADLIEQHNGKLGVIMPHFPDRTAASIRSIASRHNLGKIKGHYYPSPTKSLFNPNPITSTTRILVHNYYNEDIKNGFSHDMAIKDICNALNRDKETVERILKGD